MGLELMLGLELGLERLLLDGCDSVSGVPALLSAVQFTLNCFLNIMTFLNIYHTNRF